MMCRTRPGHEAGKDYERKHALEERIWERKSNEQAQRFYRETNNR